MGQRDHSPPASYLHSVEQVLNEPLALSLSEEVLAFAAGRAFRRGIEPREAAVLICHEHSRRLCQHLTEQGETASDMVEFAIANRIDGCADLAAEMDHDLLKLLPDLPSFVRQACFSDEFRDTIAHLATWHGIPDHRWSVAEGRPSDAQGATL